MRVFLRTHGCRANQYDSETVRAMVVAAGGTVVESAEDADLAVFNSCAVTHEAVVDLRKDVRRATRRNARLQSVIMGCAPTTDSESLAALPGVTDLVHGADFPALASALGLPIDAVTALPLRQTGTRALLRVQDGCDEHCTFCATTVARGANRSRPVEPLVHEAIVLAERHPEIVITGIHIGTYGHDIGTTLGALMETLILRVPRVRFRLTSVEATEVDERLAGLFAHPDRLAPHLHAPLQSGSDRVLRRMGRHWYTAASYAGAVERLVASGGTFAVGADLIAGFPGERDADHAESMAVVASLPFTYLHVFPFSRRPGTAAERLGDHLPPDIVARRAGALRVLGQEKEAAYRQARIGGSADVVVIRPAGVEGSERQGLTEDYLTVSMLDPALPRGSRVAATLELDKGRLVARSWEPAIA